MLYGSSIWSERKNNVMDAWRISPLGGKSYPYVADTKIGNIYENDLFHVKLSTGYAKPQTGSSNATNVYFYNEGSDVILNVDYHKRAENDTISLPNEFEGLKITVLDNHDSLTVNSEFVVSNSINISSTDTVGYVTMKLSLELLAPANIATSISDTDLVIDWDITEGATGYNVYSSDDPYGMFALVSSVTTNYYTVPISEAMLFYYIVAVKE